jgi:hypothetical protein
MKMAENFTVSLFLSNVLCIKISLAETILAKTISSSCHEYSMLAFKKITISKMTNPHLLNEVS